jgi:hypothetical protein
LVVLDSTISKLGGKDMDAIGQSGMFTDNRVIEKSGPVDYVMLSSENPSGVISIPKIRGGVVTRMTVNPASGVISEIFIETSESSIAFPDEVRFDLDAKINIQRIIIVGGSGMDHQ